MVGLSTMVDDDSTQIFVNHRIDEWYFCLAHKIRFMNDIHWICIHFWRHIHNTKSSDMILLDKESQFDDSSDKNFTFILLHTLIHVIQMVLGEVAQLQGRRCSRSFVGY